MKNYILKYTLILLVACLGMQQAGAKVWYVNSPETQWQGKAAADVKTDIASAITAAADGDEIWVAAGEIYVSATISLNKSVSIYGGFAGTETKIEDRKMVTGGQPWEFENPTLLMPKSTKILLLKQGAKFTKKVVIDGLTITGGAQGLEFVNSHTETYIQNCIIKGNSSATDGTGAEINNANIVMRYCLVEGNSTTTNGGGIVIAGAGPKVEFCHILNNTAKVNGAEITQAPNYYGFGGGIFNNSGTVSNCVIQGNKGAVGGGVLLRRTASKFYNCLIIGNEAKYGAGVGFTGHNADSKDAKVYNCIIAENISTKGGGGVHFTNDGQAIINSIFWENKKNTELSSVETIAGKTATIENGILQANSGTVEDHNNITVEDRLQVFAAEDSWLPAEESVGIDKGQAVSGMPTTDLAGNIRVAGRGIDIGAYESQIVPKPDGNIFYVDQAATGKMNGSSWTNAFLDIQTAINAAKVYNEENNAQTQIWVAAGTYNLEATISIQSGVSIYGGFDKTEKNIGERKMNSVDPWDLANPTILKGNKTCQIINSTEPNNDKAITESTYVNGFTMTGGKAVGSGDYYTCGGAAHLKQNMFIQNCILTGNEANNQGGGIALRGDAGKCGMEYCLVENNVANGAGGGVSLFGNAKENYIRNCVIRNNESKATGTNTGGGGVYNFLGSIENCKIMGNKALRGGGVAFRRYMSTSMVNCLVENNTATAEAGAIFFSGHQSQAAVNIFSCTVVGNHAPAGMNVMGYSEAENGKTNNFTTIKIVNSIFDQNEGTLANENMLPKLNITYSAFGETIAGTGNIVIPQDDTFWGENWHLTETSIAKNAGTTEGVTVLDYDLDGAERVQDGHIDMGAYEVGVVYVPDANGVFYVKADGNNSNSGNSWENALQDINFALTKAEAYNKKLITGQVPARLWVAGGNYELTEGITLVDGISMYGGFAGTETTLEERDKEADAWNFTATTVLKDKTGKSLIVLNQTEAFNTATRIEGFTLTNGKQGAKLKGNVILSHCIVRENIAGNVTDGAGIHAGGTGCIIDSCLVDANIGKNGGGVLVENGAVIRNSSIQNNVSEYTGSFNQGWGGGIFNNSATVENCVISGNKAPHGGGIFVRHAASKFYNCLVVSNHSSKTGGGVAFDSYAGSNHVGAVKDAKIYNFTIVNNTTDGEGAGIYFSNEGQTALNTILYGNKKSGGNADEFTAMDAITPVFVSSAVLNAQGLADGNIVLAENSKIFTDAAAGDWSLCEGSVCEDKGSAVDGMPVVALGGNAREQGRRIDIGAYERDSDFEYKPDANGIVYVCAGKDGHGSSWEDAAGDVVTAIRVVKKFNDALDEDSGIRGQVWVAAGTYRLRETVQLADGVSVYGGFAGTETSLEERQAGNQVWEYANPVILTDRAGKEIVMLNQTADFVHPTVVDGLVVTNGLQGAVVKGNLTLSRCTFRENGTAVQDGAGVYAAGELCVVSQCLIENNTGNRGAGVMLGSSARLENCVIAGNESNQGGGVFITHATAQLFNCLVKNNNAVQNGGGVAFTDTDDAVNAKVCNFTVVNNTTAGSGAGIWFTREGQGMVNTILYGNKKNAVADEYAVQAGVSPVFTTSAILTTETLTEGNIALSVDDKVFTDAAGGDWTLCLHSVCEDRGSETEGLPALALGGNERKQHNGIDMGAYERDFSFQVSPEGIVYVVKGQNGQGSSWDNAVGDVGTAIQVAKAYNDALSDGSKPKAQVWVQAGEYQLSQTIIPLDGVSVYGGFAGTETELSQRAKGQQGWEYTHPTILRGKDKSFAILAQNKKFTEQTVIDGFTIEEGKTGVILWENALLKGCIVRNNKSPEAKYTLNGVSLTLDGGGIYAKSGCTVDSCLFENNEAMASGGGIYMADEANVVVRNCLVQNNKAATRGGGIFSWQGRVENSIIRGNQGGTEGGGIVVRNSGAVFYSCLIEDNTAATGGGVWFGNNSAADAKVYNLTVVNNKATTAGGGIHVGMNGPTVVNTIIWGNTLNGEPSETAGSTATYKNCASTATLAGSNIVLSKNSSEIFADDWKLCENSPCIDKGTEEVGEMPNRDVYGSRRFCGDTYDIGASEYFVELKCKADANGIFYVVKGAEMGTGESWESPVNALEVVLGNLKQWISAYQKIPQIWIAKGTYALNKTYEMYYPVSIYGGFAGTEKSLDERQKVAGGQPWEFENETILEGSKKIQLFNQKTDFTSMAYLDGLTIRNAKHTDKGGAMYIQSNVTIQYCKFITNTTSSNGGAINFVGKAPLSKVVYSYFYGNEAGNGGAIFTEASKAEIENCWIEKSKADKRGGGVYVYQGVVRNSYITRNHCNGNEAGLGGGGGLYGRDGGSFYNCIVVDNTSNRGAGIMAGLNKDYSFVTNVFNCVVAGNQATESGAGLYASPCKSEYGLKAYNTLLWNNSLSGALTPRMELVQLFNCALQDGTGIVEVVDQNCIAIATEDKDAAFDVSWRPVLGSACIDAGTAEGITLATTDYDGNKRISNRTVDIGVYEYQNPADVFEIHFKDEILTYVPDAQKVVECSADRDNWQTVPYSSLIQKETTKGYCRLQEAPETVYVLDIPGRGEVAGKLDMVNETLTAVAEGAEWNITGTFAAVGEGKLTDYIRETEGQVTVRQPATEKAFKTETVFIIPARRAAPDLTLSFVGEKLVAADETADMTLYEVNKDQGAWQELTADASVTELIPEELAAFSLSVRSKATDSDFVSNVKSWNLQGRQIAPLYTIHYADSTTNEVVAATVEYDTVNTFASVSRGQDMPLKLMPGMTYYFRKVASDEAQAFVSPVSSLEVPVVLESDMFRVNYADEKLEGLNEYVVWRINGGAETQALEDLSGVISSEGEVTLTVYIPQGVNAFATPEHTIVLPKREAAPAWAINYSDEVIFEPTDQLTPDNWEIKLSEDGAYTKLDDSGVLKDYIPAPGRVGRTIWLRTAAGVDAFHSEASEVSLPARPETPAITIDFATEYTREVIPENVEYSMLDDMEAAIMGGDTLIPLEPGVDLYFRVKATENTFASGVAKLAVPERPAISEVSIDFENEALLDLPPATVWQVGEGEITPAKEELTGMIPAAGEPDAMLKIWVPQQENSFRSEIIILNLPAYPANPQLAINYEKEELEGITANMMWSYEDTTYAARTDISALIPAYGENERNLSVWVAASEHSFRSTGETTLVLSARKDNAFTYSIDYVAETTSEIVSSDITYGFDSGDEAWETGKDAVIQLQPGRDMWFKRKADAENKLFASSPVQLVVPSRPVITAEDMEIRLEEGEYLPDIRNSWTNTFEGINMMITEPEVAVLQGNRILPKKQGECELKLTLDAVAGEHFAAESRTVLLKVISAGGATGELAVANLKIAGRSDMIFRIPELDGVSGVSLIVYNQWGKVIFEAKEYGQNFDMGNLDAGTYYYVLTYPKDGRQQKKKGFVEIVR